jgi:hypothetical protein
MYRMFLMKTLEKLPCGRQRRKLEDNIKMDLNEVGYANVICLRTCPVWFNDAVSSSLAPCWHYECDADVKKVADVLTS